MTLSKQFLLMLFASVLLGLGARVVQKQPVPMWGFPKPSQLVQPQAAVAVSMASPDSAFVPSDKAYSVDLSTALGLYMKRKKANVHFIDAREPALYSAGHIAGSINIPFEKLSQYQTVIDTLPKADLFVLYCDGGDCHLSHDLSDVMLQDGFKRVAVFTGGWAEWSTEATDFIEPKQ